MIKRFVNRGVLVRGKPAQFFLMLAMLLPLVGAAPVAMPDPSARVQPLLLDMAAGQPDTQVRVIVQKSVKAKDPEAAAARLGGTITKDLYIINAFAAELPAKAVPELAQTQGVRWVSLDAAMVKTGDGDVYEDNLQSIYPWAVNAPDAWGSGSHPLGQGIGVAVVDSGVSGPNGTHLDLTSETSNAGRVVASVEFGSSTNTADHIGHGTHVAGIVGGNGLASNRAYVGIAPRANLINVKVSNDTGGAMSSDVVAGLQWVLQNKNTYNIKVVNLSLNSSVMQSYHVDPLDAAVEVLWFNRIVVVVAAGNNGTNGLFPPANDPFVITVGAADDKGTMQTGDDEVASFSAYGLTSDGVAKPDLVAPGVDIISLLASNTALFAVEHPDHLVSGFPGSQHYFRMSGTSMATPMVAGAVALLLQDEPNLNPDQVKYRLKATTRNLSGTRDGAGMLDVREAVNGNTTQTANTGQRASQLLWTGTTPVRWTSVNWSSVNWSSVNWSSVNWSSVNWSSVNWSSVVWDD